MNKKDILLQIRAAKGAFSLWKSNAAGILNGMQTDLSQAPLLATETKFGRWFYTRGQAFSHYYAYKDIDRLLIDIHQLYMKMYALTFSEPKGGLFKSKKKIKQKNLEEAQSLIHDFNFQAESLLNALSRLEEEISETNDEQIANLVI